MTATLSHPSVAYRFKIRHRISDGSAHEELESVTDPPIRYKIRHRISDGSAHGELESVTDPLMTSTQELE